MDRQECTVGATLTTASAVAKEIFEDYGVVGQLSAEAVALKRVESTGDGVETDKVGGKYVKFPIRVRRNPGIGYRNELETLPTAGNQGYAEVRTGLRYGYGRITVTGPSMRLLDTNVQAFVDVVDDEMEGLKDDLVKDSARIVYGDASGSMAVLSGTHTTANVCQVADAQYLAVGDIIDIVSTGGTVRGSARTITAISGTSVTYSGADIASDANTDLIVRTGSYSREPNGFSSIVKATGALYNVDPAVEPIWASTVDANGGTLRALSEGLMIAMVDAVRRKSGKRPSVILASLGVRRAYFNLLQQQRRYTDTKTFAGGFEGLAFHVGKEIPVVDDPDAPASRLWFLHEPSIKVYRDGDWKFDDTDGAIWSRITDVDGYEARAFKYWEIGVKQRNAHGVITDITEG
jgi:hypothetical protein